MTTVLTREYLDARPGGWLDYAPLRIAQLYGSQNLFLLLFVCVNCIALVYCEHLYYEASVVTSVLLVGGQRSAIIRLFVKSTSIYYYLRNPPFIHGSFVLALLLGILGTF